MTEINWAEFWEIIMPGWTITKLAAYFTLLLIGVILHLTLDVRKSMKRDKDTPDKFSFRFLVKDNPFRWLGITLLLILSIIFFEDINGYPLTPLIAISIGWNIDSLVGYANSTTKKRIKGTRP